LTLLERVLVLNLYGSLLLALAPMTAAGAFILLELAGELGWMRWVYSLTAGIPLLLWGVHITAKLPKRVRTVRVLVARIERRGFKANYFEHTCGTFCMRRVTRLVLRKVGQEDLYPTIIAMYSSKGQLYIEHTSPLVEELIATGALSEEEIHKTVVDALLRARKGRRTGNSATESVCSTGP
jgi:hypothetical protein